MSRILIRYLVDQKSAKAGTEAWTSIEDAQRLIAAGTAALAGHDYSTAPRLLNRERMIAAAQNFVLAGTGGQRVPVLDAKLYGESEIVAELNRRTGTAVSVKHGMKWLRKRGAAFEPSDRPGSRTSLNLSEFDRLKLPAKPTK